MNIHTALILHIIQKNEKIEEEGKNEKNNNNKIIKKKKEEPPTVRYLFSN